MNELTRWLLPMQDFWNVAPHDPMVHCSRFFYGPALQGRDGLSACPCCGTGAPGAAVLLPLEPCTSPEPLLCAGWL